MNPPGHKRNDPRPCIKLCECGNVALPRKRMGTWVCARCSEIEERRTRITQERPRPSTGFGLGEYRCALRF